MGTQSSLRARGVIMKSFHAVILGLLALCLIAIVTFLLHGSDKSNGPAANRHNLRGRPGRPLKPNHQENDISASHKYDKNVVPNEQKGALPPAPPPSDIARKTVNFPTEGKYRPLSERPQKSKELPEKILLTRRGDGPGPGPPSYNAAAQGVQKPLRFAHHFVVEEQLNREVGAMPSFNPNQGKHSVEL